MWNLSRIQWKEARSRNGFKEAEDIKVAVLDTGIQADHPDLEDRVAKYVFQHPAIPSASSDKDIIGHGTHVAGTIGAVTGNSLGINGICHCQIYAWKIFDDKPDYDRFDDEFVYYVDTVMYHRALADCLTEGVDIINLSIGGQGRPDLNEQRLFSRLLSQGVTIVAAMGNEGLIGSPVSYPAAIPGVIAVGATKADDRRANFSNYGNHISICAPGVSIWSTLPTYPGQSGFEAVLNNGGRRIPGRAKERETDYDAWNGTSMASPHVAAASALLIANKGRMSPADVKTRLEQTADKVVHMNGSNFTTEYGNGRLNLFNLL
jgi:subtilisin family serine protease